VKNFRTNLGRLVSVILTCMWVFFPFYFLVIISLNETRLPLGLEIPEKIGLIAYSNILFGKFTLWKPLFNSIITSGLATVGVIIIAVFCGYGISRLKSRITTTTQMSFFILRIVPPIVLTIPIYLLFINLKLWDTILGLVLVLIAINLPFAVLVMKAFYDSIPIAMEEAAWIDGASIPQTLIKIVAPLSVQGVIAVGLITFLQAYIEFLLPVVLAGKNTETLTLFIGQFQTLHETYIEEMAAASVIAIIPMVSLYIFAQKYMRRMLITGTH